MELITLLPFLFAVLSLVFVISAIYGFDAIKLYVRRDRALQEFKLLRAEAAACQSDTELYEVFCRLNELVKRESWLFYRSMLRSNLAFIVKTNPAAWTAQDDATAGRIIAIMDAFYGQD